MSFNNPPPPPRDDLGKSMAKWEINRRAGNPAKAATWHYWLRTEVVINWPSGWAPLDESGELHANSADPNDWYRWWLEKHVGAQGWMWDWREKVGATIHSPGYEHLYNDRIVVKFRNPEHATMFALKFS